jgi:hypothetical protein
LIKIIFETIAGNTGWRITTVKSRENKIDTLHFPWDHKAAQTFRIKQMGIDIEPDFERYLDWLEEIKPRQQELRQAKIFNKPFILES